MRGQLSPIAEIAILNLTWKQAAQILWLAKPASTPKKPAL